MIKTVKLFDAQTSSDYPQEVEEDVRKIWVDQELGNDYYYFHTCLADLREDYVDDDGNPLYPNLVKYLGDQGLEEKESILIHWWW